MNNPAPITVTLSKLNIHGQLNFLQNTTKSGMQTATVSLLNNQPCKQQNDPSNTQIVYVKQYNDNRRHQFNWLIGFMIGFNSVLEKKIDIKPCIKKQTLASPYLLD